MLQRLAVRWRLGAELNFSCLYSKHFINPATPPALNAPFISNVINSHMVHLIFQKVFYNLGRGKVHMRVPVCARAHTHTHTKNFSNFRWPGCEQSISIEMQMIYYLIYKYLFYEWEKIMHSIRSGPFLGGGCYWWRVFAIAQCVKEQIRKSVCIVAGYFL